MKWPWQREREPLEMRQASTGFTDLVVAGLLARASGDTTNDATATAAVEVASGIWSTALAGATIEPENDRTRAITPRFLAMVGRNWIRRGEDVHAIDATRGKLALLPSASWDVSGSAHPATWFYRVDLFAPSSVQTPILHGASVVHSAWATNAEEPWRGVPPWRNANLSSSLLASLERRLGQEANTPVAQLLTIPADPGEDDPEDGEPDEFELLKKAIGSAKGEAYLLETTQAAYGQGPANAPQRDWLPARLGANPPAAMVQLRTDAETSVLAACGVPAGLVLDRDGTASREAIRRFYTTIVEPKAAALADELAEKLETPVSFSFRSAWAHDLVGRVTALKGMIEAGVPLAEAMRQSGLADV